jgi:hypothetical protein
MMAKSLERQKGRGSAMKLRPRPIGFEVESVLGFGVEASGKMENE